MAVVREVRKNTPIGVGGLPFSSPAFGGIAGSTPPASSPEWVWFPAQGDRVDRAVLASWGSTNLKIQGTFVNVADSDADEYFVTIGLYDVINGAIIATAAAALAAPARYAQTSMSSTFLASVLTTSGPLVAAWAYHVAPTVSPASAAPQLSFRGFHVQQA